MSYARNLLARGEEIVFESRQHWFAVVARTWLWIVVAIVALAVLIWATSELTGTLRDVLQIAGALAMLLALGRIGLVIWGWRNQEYLVTTRRIIKAEGILNKHLADSSLEKVNDARLRQSLIGRIVGYGTLDILTAAEDLGGDGIEDFPMMADPVRFKIAMLNQKELMHRPDLAQPRWQRSGPAPDLQRPEALPPRAGSSRVHEVVRPPEAEPIPAGGTAAAGAAAAGGAGAAAAGTDGPEASAPADPRTSDAQAITDTLERLAGLRDRGLITDDEYQAKKQQLLERL